MSTNRRASKTRWCAPEKSQGSPGLETDAKGSCEVQQSGRGPLPCIWFMSATSERRGFFSFSYKLLCCLLPLLSVSYIFSLKEGIFLKKQKQDRNPEHMVGFLPACLDPSCVNSGAGLWIRSFQQPWPVGELHRDEGCAGCLPGPCSFFFTAPAPSAPFVKSSAVDTHPLSFPPAWLKGMSALEQRPCRLYLGCRGRAKCVEDSTPQNHWGLPALAKS